MVPEHALRHAEKALLEHAALGRTTVSAGSLRACLATGAADALMHVAVPSGPEPADWAASVEALVALRADHGIVPRLEFMAELHPSLGPTLEHAGFLRMSADPVMTADLSELADGRARAPRPTGYTRLTPRDDALLVAFIKAQAGAFGMPPATGYAFLDRLQDTLANGRSMVAALLEDGAPVSGAVLQLGTSGWGELAGVFTVEPRRRHGLAATLCSTLLADAHAAGHTHAWLSAAEDARGLYTGLGFQLAGTQLGYRYAPFSAPLA